MIFPFYKNKITEKNNLFVETQNFASLHIPIPFLKISLDLPSRPANSLR